MLYKNRIQNKVFLSHLILSYLIYGGEIWGMFDTNSASCKKTSDYILEKVYASGISEKSHSRFMKYILGKYHCSYVRIGTIPYLFLSNSVNVEVFSHA